MSHLSIVLLICFLSFVIIYINMVLFRVYPSSLENPRGLRAHMKQAHSLETLVMILVVSGCTPQVDREPSSPGAVSPSPATIPGTATPQQEQKTSSAIEATNHLAASDGQTLATLPAKEREALYAGGRALVEEFVSAFSRGDTAAAETKFVSKKAFEAIVAPGFQSILGAGLLAKNKQELANLVEALRGHKVESWKWKPGKLVKTKPQSAFASSLIQFAGGTIELEVDGAFIAVRIDQMVQLDGTWMIFQMHNL